MRIKISPDKPGEYNVADILTRARNALVFAFPEYDDEGSGVYVSTDLKDTIDLHLKKR